MENKPHLEQEGKGSDTPVLTDVQIVRALHKQQESLPEEERRVELPPVGESGQRTNGEIHLTRSGQAVRHHGYKEVDGELVPIAYDLDKVPVGMFSDGSIRSGEQVQLHDDFYVSHEQPSRRMSMDEALITADIMRREKYSAGALATLDEAVARGKEIEEELPKLEEQYAAMSDVSVLDRSEAAKQKQDLGQQIRKIQTERNQLRRQDYSTYGAEYRELDKKAEIISSNYISRVYQLNPDYFKDMPVREFVAIGDELAKLEKDRRATHMESPTEPGGYYVEQLFYKALGRLKNEGKRSEYSELVERKAEYTAVDYLEERIANGDFMTPDEITGDIESIIASDRLDEDVFTKEDREAYKAIGAGFYDRTPRETYQMYVEMMKNLAEAVSKQSERNQARYDEFLADLKSRKSSNDEQRIGDE